VPFYEMCKNTVQVDMWTGAQAADGNTAPALCMLDNSDYKHTLRIRNTYCFSIATMVARTRIIVTLYVHSLYCYVVRT